MKLLKITLLLIVLVLNSNEMFSQSKWQIGLSSGITPGNYSDKLGFGTLASLSYKTSKNIDLFLSYGLLTWNNISYYENIYNIKITPIIFGAKYYFSLKNFQPYFLLEVEKILGTLVLGFGDLVNPVLPGEPEPPGIKEYSVKTVNMNGFTYAFGMGAKYKINDNVNFESSLVSNFYADKKAEDAFHVRLFVGFNYIF